VRPRHVDVVILYDGGARELDAAYVLQVILDVRHGMSTEILQKNDPSAWVVRDLRPKVVVLPYCYYERSFDRFLVRWRDAAYFNLAWEQLFYAGNTKAKTPRGVFAVDHVIHNAWSEEYAGLLRGAGVPEDHIFVSGHPAYALYGEPYRAYFKSRSDLARADGLDPLRRWVFFPENYNWAFYDQSQLDQMVRDGQPADQVESMRDAVTRSFETAMAWCRELVEHDVELVLRPRPLTPLGTFRDRVEQTLGGIPPRMTITQHETVREWILASDVVLSSYSTSLIEASIAGKPAFIVEPTPWPTSLQQDWYRLVPRLTTSAELVGVATGRVQAELAPVGAWARERLLGRGDPLLAIADELAAIRRGSVPVPGPAPWQSITMPSRYPLPRRAVYGWRRHLRPYVPRRVDVASGETRADESSLGEMPVRVQRWRDILVPYLAKLGPAA
jgi:surface carbohydrate biosynthesis protein